MDLSEMVPVSAVMSVSDRAPLRAFSSGGVNGHRRRAGSAGFGSKSHARWATGLRAWFLSPSRKLSRNHQRRYVP